MNSRIKVIGSIVAILLVVLVAIGTFVVRNRSPESGDPIDTLTIGAYAGDTASLVWIANDQGYFEDNGLDVTIKEYEAGKLAADALISGDVDIATTAEFVLVSNSFTERDLRILSIIATAQVNELIARRDRGIQQPSDLVGKRIGVTRKSIGEFFLGSFLLFQGLTLQDVEVVDLTPSEIVAGIVDGEIDAAMTWDPNIYEIKNRLGENEIHWSGQSGADLYFILLGREAWIESHPSVVEKCLKSLIQAEEFVIEHNDTARTQIEDRFDYDPEYMKYIWSQHDFVVALPQALLTAMEDEARWMMENNLVDQTTVPNFLDYIYLNGLEAVNPVSVTIIR